MENVSDAIILAGSVLLLIIALSISISSLTNLKTQTQNIYDSRDQVVMAQDTSGKYINYITTGSNQDVRSVGVETIISELRRMRKESFTIYIAPIENIFFSNLQFNNKLLTTLNETQYYTDENNQKQILINNSSQIIKLSMTDQDIIFYSDLRDETTGQVRKIQELNKDLVSELYKIFNNKKFKEYIGIYQEKTSKGVSDANKKTNKIITFIQQ